MSAFGSEWLTTDIKDMKKRYKNREQILEAEVVKFKRAVHEPVSRVAAQCRLLLATQAARSTCC